MQLVKLVESYIKDSDGLLKDLKDFGVIGEDTSITIADTVVMYPNSDNDEALF